MRKEVEGVTSQSCAETGPYPSSPERPSPAAPEGWPTLIEHHLPNGMRFSAEVFADRIEMSLWNEADEPIRHADFQIPQLGELA